MIADDSRVLFKQSLPANAWIQMFLDHLVVQSLLFTHTFLRTDDFSDEYRILAVLTFLSMILIYNNLGIYQRQLSRNDYIGSLLQAWGTVILLLAVFGFVTKASEEFSRGVILGWAVTGFFGQWLVYILTRKVILRTLPEATTTLIVGGGSLGRHIAGYINGNEWIPDQVIGFVDNHADLESNWDELGLTRLGCVDQIYRIVAENRVRKIYITTPMEESSLVSKIAPELIEANIDVIWAPDIFGVNLLNYSLKEIAGVPLISLSQTPLVGGAALAKTIMDKTIAFTALVLFSPLMLITALLVKLTSRGPVLFKQHRLGWDGRPLEIYKFRSMKVHQEQEGTVIQAKKGDDRLTLIGGFIRRTSIDELPQLLNVLSGSMSLVGPRPHAMAHNDFYKEKIEDYMLRHRIKPGLTGLAQVNGFRGETDTLDKMEGRVRYDLNYINNWSIWLDLEILFRTVFVLFSKNAY